MQPSSPPPPPDSAASARSWSRRLEARLFERIDGSSLAALRILFGLVMMWEVVRYLRYGWIAAFWIEPQFHFSYPLFGWVTPWPGVGMHLHFGFLGGCALLITVGLFYRPAALLFFLGFSYMFLLEEARYLNHFYFVILLSFLLIFVPANRRFSLDRRLGRVPADDAVPAWTLGLLRAQVGVVYFFGGIAKINGDWLRGNPLRQWLAKRTDFPLVGHLFTEDWMILLISYGGLLLDLLVVPLLLWWRSRPFALILVLAFHTLNARWFNIGIFPWLTIAATTLFFPPSWPRALLRDLRHAAPARRAAMLAGAALGASCGWFAEGATAIPLLTTTLGGTLVGWSLLRAPSELVAARRPATAPVPIAPRWRRRAVAGVLGAWLLVQVTVPLRHFLVPSVVHWTEEGHRFAWHMKLRSKDGDVRVFATDPASGESWEIDPLDTLTPWQLDDMATRPYMMRQFAVALARSLAAEGRGGIEIRMQAEASLNGRPPSPLIDPTVDLVRASDRAVGRQPWILQLEPSPLSDAPQSREVAAP